MTWAQLAAIAQPLSTTVWTASHQAVGQASDVSAGDYSAFMKQLNESGGKSVKIVFQSGGRTNIYGFTLK
jgi:hypothetical protein